MDFRNVSRLFADPDWDGPIEMDDDFDPNRDKPEIPPVGWTDILKVQSPKTPKV
jgi:type I restriction enzyme R subunit